MKDKLVQIIKSVPITEKAYEEYISDIAEKIIDEGVILPPCKVGEKIYVVRFGKCEEHIVEKIEQCRDILHIAFGWRNMGYEWISAKEFGKTVFLTREKAEKALKGMVSK